MSGHAAAPAKPAPAAGAADAHSVGRPVRDLAAEIYVQLISKVPDPGKAESMAKLSFKLAEAFQQVDDARIHAAKPVAADFNAEFFDTPPTS
jgi:hypothetical protein